MHEHAHVCVMWFHFLNYVTNYAWWIDYTDCDEMINILTYIIIEWSDFGMDFGEDAERK